MAHKNYIIDTSVLIHDINCISVFEDNDVIIPIAVLEELDSLKIRPASVGASARTAIRKINEYCEMAKDFKEISTGIDIGNNIKFSIDVKHTKDDRFNAGSKDDSILACAFSYQDSILVSKDINLRVRAKAFGIKAEDYSNDKIENISELYTGYKDVDLDDSFVDKMNENGFLIKDTLLEEKLLPNECVQIAHNGKKSIFRRKVDLLAPIRIPTDIWSLKSKNREQAYALDLLLDPNVPLVTLSGRAGTGKTLITIAAALELCINQKKYAKVEIYKAIQPVGNDLGFLPGTLEEKLTPWMGGIYNSLEFLLGANYEQLLFQYKDKIKMEAMTYIRGKSINKAFIVLDEAQNISRGDIKTVLTRVGFDTKIIFLGDLDQIDNTYLDETNNGLTYVIETFKNSPMAGHITLIKGERSPLATEASRIL